ncbi:Acyltransferase family protein [Photobacterium malacitanum]|uniref:Acyltransferase family protein n=1 Tax=Photobacterium malacitanum TaxID=2204294 RepID=A0A1Y6M7K4_9GAMM|nr:acyltransferase family protein [Photobacterium malacitanum]SMY31728.1 Acyltransferase family protein [Photobacterium malacitanum]
MSQSRVASFECGRIIATIAIIALHCQIFMQAPLFNGQPLLGMGLNQMSRFAVPLFFIMAGYFIQPRLTTERLPYLWHYARPLLIMWVSWSIIYLILPFNFHIVATDGYFAERSMYWQKLLATPLNTLFEGGLVHLWYIPGLLSGLTVITILLRCKLERLIIPVASGLFIFGLMAGSYAQMTDLSSPIFTRNGPFFSTFMIMLGFEVRRRNISLSLKYSMTMLVIGFGLFIGEANYLSLQENGSFFHDFLFGTPLWALGIFFVLLAKPNFGDNKITHTLSKDVLGIYLCHLIIVIYYLNIVRLLGINSIIASILAVPVVLIISTLIVRGLRKTPIARFLVR